jgi:thiamine biosynthesis lipoprotein
VLTGKLALAALPWRKVARAAPAAAPLFAAFLAFTANATSSNAREFHGNGLGSTWRVTLVDRPSVDAITLEKGIQARIDTLTQQLSRWNPNSTLSQLNASPNDTWQPLPGELFTALGYALALAKETGGAYDPTVAPLVDVWGFGTTGRRYSPPSTEEITAARQQVGWQKITLDAAEQRIQRPVGLQIDLSSMTHGFAADQVASYLRSVGVTRYLVDVGSELRAQGDDAKGRPWQVAIERPPPELTPVTVKRAHTSNDNGAMDEPPMHVVALRNAGIATSGNYRYFFDYNGRRYSHRIDPRTAEPISSALAAVTVIAPEAMHADALATALTVLGPEDGLEYAQSHDIAALFILRGEHGLEERMTPQFRAYLN